METGGTPDGERQLGGAGRIRTGDPLLAKQVLYQLSYDPFKVNNYDMLKNVYKIYFVRSMVRAFY